MPEDQRWSADALLGVVGTPWDPTPNIDAEDAARLPNPNPEADMEDVIPKQSEDGTPVARRMYIRRADVERFGQTPGCVGCRDRIEGLLQETEAGKKRVDNADYRMAEAIMRESERASRMAEARTNANAELTGAAPPSTIRESAVGSVPGADEASQSPPPEQDQWASTGQGGGDAETRQSARGAKRAADRSEEAEEEPEHVSRRLPDEETPLGQKRRSTSRAESTMTRISRWSAQSGRRRSLRAGILTSRSSRSAQGMRVR